MKIIGEGGCVCVSEQLVRCLVNAQCYGKAMWWIMKTQLTIKINHFYDQLPDGQSLSCDLTLSEWYIQKWPLLQEARQERQGRVT